MMDETSSMLSAQPGLLKTMSVLVLGLLLVMLVLKPMTRQMMTALSQTPPLALSSGRGGAEAGGIAGHAAPELTAGRAIDAQGLYEHVSAQIRKEPAQSTRLLESWIGESTEEGD
jgi:flagellar M-ring protein FliF